MYLEETILRDDKMAFDRPDNNQISKSIGEENVRVVVDGSIAEVIIDRPERKNAVSLAMWRTIARMFNDLGETAGVRVIIMRGAGGNFCVGADISEFSKTRDTVPQVRDYDKAVDDCCDAIAEAPKPVIAAIEGYCIGGGCGLAMACDFRICTPDATFFIPVARLGIVYGIREIQNLLALVGLSQAKRILYTAERFGADRAHQIGLVDDVSSDPLEAAKQLAGIMAANAPLTIAGTKSILTDLSMGLGKLSEAHALKLVEEASQSADHREARAAFLEKRQPVFKGR